MEHGPVICFPSFQVLSPTPPLQDVAQSRAPLAHLALQEHSFASGVEDKGV